MSFKRSCFKGKLHEALCCRPVELATELILYKVYIRCIMHVHVDCMCITLYLKFLRCLFLKLAARVGAYVYRMSLFMGCFLKRREVDFDNKSSNNTEVRLLSNIP